MKNIEKLNESLFQVYNNVLEDKISLRKAMVAANVANALLRGIVVQTQMCLPDEQINKLPYETKKIKS